MAMVKTLTRKDLLEIEQRVVLLSIYCDVILKILRACDSLSVTKLLIVSFVLKTRHGSEANVFDGRVQQKCASKAICELAGRFNQLIAEIPFFADALLLLIKNGEVESSKDGMVFISNAGVGSGLNKAFEAKLIAECKELSDAFLLLEVLRNV